MSNETEQRERVPCGAPIKESKMVPTPPRRKVGFVLCINSKARTLAWKIATSFEKQKPEDSIYRQIYDNYKAQQQIRLEPKPGEQVKGWKGRARNRALRYTAKQFLATYWLAARRDAGLPTTPPYAIAVMGHSGSDPAIKKAYEAIESQTAPETQESGASLVSRETHKENAGQGNCETQGRGASQSLNETHLRVASHSKREPQDPPASHGRFETHSADASHFAGETQEDDADVLSGEVRAFVELYYDLQKSRIKMSNAIDAIRRGTSAESERQEPALDKVMKLAMSLETALIDVFDLYRKDRPGTPWLGGVRGIGPILTANLIATYGDCRRFPTISKLWAWSGLSSNHYQNICQKGHKSITSSAKTSCPVTITKGEGAVE